MGTRISGAILAGGSNKRFGGITKANVVIGGISIISRILSTISDLFDEVIIVTNKPEEFGEFIQYKIVNDQFLKAGPLVESMLLCRHHQAMRFLFLPVICHFLTEKLLLI